MSVSGHTAPAPSWPSRLAPKALAAEDIAWEVQERHLDEASFCFELRAAALEAPHYTLAEVELGPERRLFEHLEGLRQGGPLVAAHLLEIVADARREPEEIAVAALGVLAGTPGQDRGVQALIAQLIGAESDAQRGGLARALELGVGPGVDEVLLRELWRELEAQPVLLAAAASHVGRGASPGLAEGRLGALLSSSDAEVVRAAALLARRDADPRTLAALASVTQATQLSQAEAVTHELRRTTLESALIHGLPGSGDWVRHWTTSELEAPSPMRELALTWLAQLGGPSEHAWLIWLASQATPSPALLWALGCSGRVGAVDRCLELLDDAALAPLAAEAICAITGLPARDERYWLAPPAAKLDDGLPPLERDDLDADLIPDGEDALPHPNAEALRAWWSQARTNFSPELRYLGGRPLDGEGLIAALDHGPARRRGALAFELAVRSRGLALVDTQAWGWAQRAALAAAGALVLRVDPREAAL